MFLLFSLWFLLGEIALWPKDLWSSLDKILALLNPFFVYPMCGVFNGIKRPLSLQIGVVAVEYRS